jgi:signal transduction histidine kinase
VKYTDAEGDIRVQTRGVDDSVVIEVTDTGVGIAHDLLPRIFDLFVQSDRTLDRSQGGLGIGLAVARRLSRYCARGRRDRRELNPAKVPLSSENGTPRSSIQR